MKIEMQAARIRCWQVGLLLLTFVATYAPAQTLTVIHNFTGAADGGSPAAGLTMDAAGNLYGTTQQGGDAGQNCYGSCGVVFKMKPTAQGWVFQTLYQFTGGNDGSAPEARVVFGPDGALYGTTVFGGGVPCQTSTGNGCGTVFRLTPRPTFCASVLCPWSETVLYRFAGGASDGAFPTANVTFDRAGNLYGTTYEGGVYTGACESYGNGWCGTVFELAHSGGGWTESLPYLFSGGDDGANPVAGVTLDQAGNLYGVSGRNGAGSGGTFFELTPSPSGWVEQTLYSFVGGMNGSSFPEGDLIFDTAGNLYGTTEYGGSGGGGAVFEFTPSGGGWTYNQVYGLSGFLQNGPLAGVTMDAAGNLYGTAFELGNNFGLVFKLTPSNGGWIYTLLHQFGYTDGALPMGTVAVDAQGNLYGTASAGGTHGAGVVWKITP